MRNHTRVIRIGNFFRDKHEQIKKGTLYKIFSAILAAIIGLGSVYGGYQAVKALLKFLIPAQDTKIYEEISMGQSCAYIESLFGVPIMSEETADGFTYKVYETKETYFSAFYEKESVIAFFVFLKDGSSIQVPYPLFPAKLGKFTYSDLSFPAQTVILDISNGNMGYSLYAEHHGSGRWGYYYTYVVGECSIGLPIKNSHYLSDTLALSDAGQYEVDAAPFWTEQTFIDSREKTYPNFLGVISSGVDIEFPTIDFYLALCEK